MNKRILEKIPLLDEKGCLKEPGYATQPLWQYNPKDITAGRFRIKEWDYYLVYNGSWAVALTVADNGYLGIVSASLIDLEAGRETTKTNIFPFPMGRLNMPHAPGVGRVEKTGKNHRFIFQSQGDERRILAEMANFKDGKTLKVDLTLTKEPRDSMVISIPFRERKNAFYYNMKTIAMVGCGTASLGDATMEFLQKDTLALLDWGRGVWTYDNVWYWGAAQGYVEGQRFGFNIGCGFGDTNAATENALFLNGEIHKLHEVEFQIPKDEKGKDDFLSPWVFTSSDNRFEMEMQPIVDRAARTSLGVILSDQHQVFGKFTGRVVLDDGRNLELKDFIGFGEKVHNKW